MKRGRRITTVFRRDAKRRKATQSRTSRLPPAALARGAGCARILINGLVGAAPQLAATGLAGAAPRLARSAPARPARTRRRHIRRTSFLPPAALARGAGCARILINGLVGAAPQLEATGLAGAAPRLARSAPARPDGGSLRCPAPGGVVHNYRLRPSCGVKIRGRRCRIFFARNANAGTQSDR